MEDRLRHHTERGRAALAALAAVVGITAAWWTLALWPAPAAPVWLERTRAVCFGATPAGGPDTAGWLLLVGEPAGMLAILVVVWGRELRAELAWLGARWARSLGLTLLPLPVLALAALTTTARSRAARAADGAARAVAPPTAGFRRLNRSAPPLALVDQHGDTVRLEQFRGRPVLIAFAYGHCETVCPLLVHDVVEASARLGQAAPVLLVVSLDPWRDTPDRLGALAAQWRLPGGAHALSGGVAAVEATLAAWGVPYARDTTSGAIVHGTPIVLLDRQGRIAYAVTGGVTDIIRYAGRL